MIAVGLVLAAGSEGRAASEIDLSGLWYFTTDPGDLGVPQKWYTIDLPMKIRLPGSMQEQGFGDDVSVDTQWTGMIVDRSWYTSPRYAPYRRPGNIKVPFWLQPKKHYVGAAWYQRTVDIPAEWKNKRIVLVLERPHWETEVWVDATRVGRDNSLSTPHEYDLTSYLSPGRHRLTIRVDNRIKDVNVGINSHSVSDHTQTNWNGIIGQIKLVATDPVWIDDVQVYPDLAKRAARVVVRIGNLTDAAGRFELSVDAVTANSHAQKDPPAQKTTGRIPAGQPAVAEVIYSLGDGMQTWDEFHPALYRLTVHLRGASSDGQVAWHDQRAVTFGMREISTRGTEFVLNGRPIFLRGTLECCIFPKTGYPPMDQAAWRRILTIIKQHGLNHVRFHSWCPPEAAFRAADELGVYFHVECASWANQGAAIGKGLPLDQWLYQEADRILKAYGNHPSFLLMAYGNEPAGPGRGAKYLGPWVEHYKAKDQRRLYTSAAGWPIIEQSQYHLTPRPRIQHWGAGLKSRINAKPPETVTDYREFISRYSVPVVSHEIGQWCVYPNFDEIAKYTGVLQAKNFEIFRDFLEANHMGDQARDFLMASGKLQVLCYKEEIESALRTPGFGGFQLLQLHDFPGQGTALVGILDPFFDSKPYVTPDEFRRFCGPIVPLARLARRVFTEDERLEAAIELYQFGARDLKQAAVRWRLETATGDVLHEGQFAARDYSAGALHPVGRISVSLREAQPPCKLKLIVDVPAARAENDWDLWVYPRRVQVEPPKDVLVVHDLDDAARKRLRAGGKVLLLIPPKRVASDVAIGFSSIFWNTAWTRNQPPHTMGILCDPKHPALAQFPTEFHSNWQWWELIHESGAMVLNDMPPRLRPIVQVIDTWFEARRLGLLFEANVDGGRLLVCSMDLSTDLAHRPVARQMRYSLLKYMASDAFSSEVEVSADQIHRLMRAPKGRASTESVRKASRVGPGSSRLGTAAAGGPDQPAAVRRSQRATARRG
ncbi:MAG: glycoside hydrolase [Planctomycetes bacterium]|nr:glycoside hydrolase [Planctomycetota bacterium]